MKMVSAAKYARAESDLKVARPYGLGTFALFISYTHIDLLIID
jgi:F0F1-type ATP synthase gamma subunit